MRKAGRWIAAFAAASALLLVRGNAQSTPPIIDMHVHAARVMHAGWPMLDDLLAALWTHPQLHVDVGAISFALPLAAFHSYLQRIVEAGFGKRVMFGSDQMVWPEMIDVAIDRIESAGFLTADQKRDILYNNAARFLGLSPQEIARHHGR